MTGEVDRATIIRLLDAAKGDLARACADAMREDPRERHKAPRRRERFCRCRTDGMG